MNFDKAIIMDANQWMNENLFKTENIDDDVFEISKLSFRKRPFFEYLMEFRRSDDEECQQLYDIICNFGREKRSRDIVRKTIKKVMKFDRDKSREMKEYIDSVIVFLRFYEVKYLVIDKDIKRLGAGKEVLDLLLLICQCAHVGCEEIDANPPVYANTIIRIDAILGCLEILEALNSEAYVAIKLCTVLYMQLFNFIDHLEDFFPKYNDQRIRHCFYHTEIRATFQQLSKQYEKYMDEEYIQGLIDQEPNPQSKMSVFEDFDLLKGRDFSARKIIDRIRKLHKRFETEPEFRKKHLSCNHCQTLFKDLHPLTPICECLGCRSVYYCSKECSTYDHRHAFMGMCASFDNHVFSLEKLEVFQSTKKFVGSGKRCEKCRKKGEKMKMCGGCRKVFYCCVKCQKEDWKEHKSVCKRKSKK